MLQSLPFISITIPNYNNAGKLSATINSCLAQTYPNLEFIIIDDFSTDNSLEIFHDFHMPPNGIAFDKVDKNRLSAKKRKLLPLLRLYRKVSA